MSAQKPNLLFEAGRRTKVIRIHAGDERRIHESNSFIQSCDEAAVFPVDWCDAAILLCVALGDVDRSIGRSVVEEQQFEISLGLIENTFDGGGEKVFGVVYGHEHRDIGHGELSLPIRCNGPVANLL